MVKTKPAQLTVEKVTLGNQELTLEVGRLAGQANGAVMARLGDTVVLATVVAGGQRDDLDYFPLYVEYQEKMYAGGKIKGSRWVKREGRPTDEATLVARLIDRSIRPLFPPDFKAETQVVVTVLSVDGENDPGVLGINAVSAALSISDIPWNGPVAGIRVGLNGEHVANLPWSQTAASRLNLVVSSSQEAIVMVEAGAKEVTEKEAVEALEFAKKNNDAVVAAIQKLAKQVGKAKQKGSADGLPTEVLQTVQKETAKVIEQVLKSEKAGKVDTAPLAAVVEKLQETYPDTKKLFLKEAVDAYFKKQAREKILTSKIRLDGRKPDEIRLLSASVGILPRTHGSALFQRGETQALSIATLGAPGLEQLIESMEREETKRYIHHYYMPGYSVGEVGRFGWPSRREVGHGALAERALEPVIPSEEEFPYTIRVVSECVSSNGSTSMASVCGSTLSLMDAGVPIKKPVAGIAMGLMVKDPDKGIEKDGYLILTDIQGMEDNIGDMDFKVAGTKDGITALQMDIKVSGVSADILGEALEKAKMARTQILETMAAALTTHRPQVSPYAPKVKVVRIAKEQIGEIIGPGGRVIRQIIAVTGAQVDVDDEGKVTVSAQDQEAVNKAAAWIEGMTREVEVGEVFEQGEVKRTLPFGAFVEILPGREGMVHVSKMATTYVKKPEDVVSIGDKVKVRVEEIDDMGRINLSMLFGEAAQHRPAPGGETPRRPERPYDRGNRFEHRPHRRFPQRDHHRSGPGRDQGSRPQESAPRRPKPTAARPHTLADWHED
jgi:polyribonucleotide nucleotidyltransferase